MTPPLRVLYGGTFDPVHDGHIAIARTARDVLEAEVTLLPAHDPPHKALTGADAGQRAAMLALALEGERGLRVDLRELRRAGPSYTVDTLAEVRRELGDGAPLAWLVGADSLRQLHAWSRWRRLFDLAHIVAVARPGEPLDAQALAHAAPDVASELHDRPMTPSELRERPAGGFAWLPLPALREESSTDIRRRIRAGLPWRGHVPAPVAAFIDHHGLYR